MLFWYHAVRVLDPADHFCQLCCIGRLHAVPEWRFEHYQRLPGECKPITARVEGRPVRYPVITMSSRRRQPACVCVSRIDAQTTASAEHLLGGTRQTTSSSGACSVLCRRAQSSQTIAARRCQYRLTSPLNQSSLSISFHPLFGPLHEQLIHRLAIRSINSNDEAQLCTPFLFSLGHFYCTAWLSRSLASMTCQAGFRSHLGIGKCFSLLGGGS